MKGDHCGCDPWPEDNTEIKNLRLYVASLEARIKKLEPQEPVTEPTWRDVTSECEVDSSMVQLTHKPDGSCITSYLYTAAYRLRKVQLFREANAALNLGQHLHPTQWAFIVEKKEP